MATSIELTQGCYAIIDDEDFQKVSNYKWHANKTKNGFIYARRTIVFLRTNGKQPQIKQYLHRFILGVEDKNILIDFKNNDPLDCRKSNLIISNSACKTHYTTLRKKNNQEKGIRKRYKKWGARIVGENGKTIYLGSFTTKEAAKTAYDIANKEQMLKKGAKNF